MLVTPRVAWVASFDTARRSVGRKWLSEPDGVEAVVGDDGLRGMEFLLKIL
jgi:hypothetical protein